jgi:glutamine cyclotransferase
VEVAPSMARDPAFDPTGWAMPNTHAAVVSSNGSARLTWRETSIERATARYF